ncbi:MAG TPA: cold shock domain-containing protein [Candidatus Sulfotelmatobacter sp.]|nr:cold shock domain-containing protein [Candidatus Sulfotelmatobacter sp.]
MHRHAAIGGERLTQKWLVKVSGVPRSTISSWATGASLPRDLDQLTAVGVVLATAAGEAPLTSVEWSRLLKADQLNGASRATGEDDPVIATIDRHHLTKPHFSGLVVDADPPRPLWRSGTMLVITLEAGPGRAVVLHGMRPVGLSRQPPRRACFGLTGSCAAGVVPRRMFTLDLDSYPVLLQAEDEEADFPFTISAIKDRDIDVEHFRVTISAAEAEVSFRLGIDWTCAGRRGTTVIDNGGKPFEVYPDGHSDLNWRCGGRHKRGCPAERLAASSSQGRVRWFDESIDSGFIIPDCGGADLYFHRTSLVPGSAGRLPRKGDPVAYEVERTRFEPRAVRVRFRH